jgi:hypothetical protein
MLHAVCLQDQQPQQNLCCTCKQHVGILCGKV